VSAAERGRGSSYITRWLSRRGGEDRLGNVTLRRCAHNALAAEEDFGRDFVTNARDSSHHELGARHEGPCDPAPREVEGEGQRLRGRWKVETETGLGTRRATLGSVHEERSCAPCTGERVRARARLGVGIRGQGLGCALRPLLR
jgi:hypothetical protein